MYYIALASLCKAMPPKHRREDVKILERQVEAHAIFPLVLGLKLI